MRSLCLLIAIGFLFSFNSEIIAAEETKPTEEVKPSEETKPAEETKPTEETKLAEEVKPDHADDFLLKRGNYEYLIVQIKVNDEDFDPSLLVTIINFTDLYVLVPKHAFKDFRIKEDVLNVVTKNINGNQYIYLNEIKDIKYELDRENLILNVNFPVAALKKQYFSGYNQIKDEDSIDGPMSGAYFNYDLTYARSDKSQALSGIQEMNYFSDRYGSLLGSAFFVKDIKNTKQDKLVRLETNWTLDNIKDIATWRVGDGITKSADWSSSTRFGGIQYATNFAVQPGIVTYPLLDFVGDTTLPTTLDVYANSRSIFNEEIKPGEFQINDIRVPFGAKTITIETKDVTGAIRDITINNYTSSDLLKKDLSDYSFSIGKQRNEFGAKSNKYRNLVGSSDYLRGINNYWTSGAHFEFMDAKDELRTSLGLTNKLLLYNYGVLSLSLSSNLNNNIQNSKSGVIAYNYSADNYNIGASLSLFDRRYKDTFIESDEFNAIRSRFFTTAGFTKDTHQFSVNYLSLIQKNRPFRMLSGSYLKQLSKDSNIRLSFGRNLLKKEDYFVTLSYRFSFGGHSVSTDITKNKTGYSKGIDVSSNNNNQNDWNYRAAVTSERSETNYNTQARKNYEYGQLFLRAIKSGDNSAQQANFKGGLVYMDNSFFVAPPISSSVVLVKTAEYSNVPVYKNNILVTKTNKKGKALVANVIPYNTSKISIDADELPLDAYFTTSDSVVAPGFRGGSFVDFNISKKTYLVGVLLDENNKKLTENYTILVDGIEEENYSGYDGLLYLENIRRLNHFHGTACKEERCCNFDAPIKYIEDVTIVNLGNIHCKFDSNELPAQAESAKDLQENDLLINDLPENETVKPDLIKK